MTDGAQTAGRLGSARLLVGLVQGLLLYGLYRAGDAHLWPASTPMVFAALALVFFYVPLIVVQGMGNLRVRTLVVWAGLAAILLAGLGAYDRWRIIFPALDAHPFTAGVSRVDLPSFALFFFAGAGLFIAQTLITAGDEERRIIAPYARYFESAWKLGVQLALAAFFVGVFWAVLWLGASLFDLIKLSFLSRLLQKAWFAIPASALATAAALHLTDMRARLVASVRSVTLVLLSWLLPLMALLAVAFLASLIVTGLDPLWKTRAATALLLTSAAALVVLINAAWQNGTPETAPPLALRIGGTAAALTLAPIVVIAGYALGLRVGQHGWTQDRLYAAACLVVAACYAFGYGWAALEGSVLRRHWLRGVAPVNVTASFLILAVLLALFSPLADPMRLAVSSQLARLESGKVAAGKFDYAYLRWHGGRFGHDALVELAAKTNAPVIAHNAKAALKAKNRFVRRRATPAEIAARINLYPADHLLPQSLLRQDWRKDRTANTPACLVSATAHCDAFQVELNGAPPDQYVFVTGNGDHWRGVVLGQDDFGHWSVVGRLSQPHCKAALEAMRAGQYMVVAPIPEFRAIEAGGFHFEIEPVAPRDACSK